MQNVPYAIVRLDATGGRVVGYLMVCPYYAALQLLGANADELPVAHAETRLWDELTQLSADDRLRPLGHQNAEEISCLVEEFAGDTTPFLVAVRPIGLAAPRFAAERLQKKLAEWVEAEQAGTPLCPYHCRECEARLEHTSMLPASAAHGERPLLYSCLDHERQAAHYIPVHGRWIDLRP